MTNKVILLIQSAVMHGAVGNNAAMPIYQYLRQPAEFVDTVQLAAHPGFGTSMLSVTLQQSLARCLLIIGSWIFLANWRNQTGYFGATATPVAQFIAARTQANEIFSA